MRMQHVQGRVEGFWLHAMRSSCQPRCELGALRVSSGSQLGCPDLLPVPPPSDLTAPRPEFDAVCPCWSPKPPSGCPMSLRELSCTPGGSSTLLLVRCDGGMLPWLPRLLSCCCCLLPDMLARTPRACWCRELKDSKPGL